MYLIVITTCNKPEIKAKIVNVLLESTLCACIQVDEVTSFYKWNNKIQSEQEYKISIKTKADLFTKIEEIITKNHDYKIPEIVAIPIINGSSKYFEWMNKEMD